MPDSPASPRPLNKEDLARVLAQELGIGHRRARRVLEALLDAIASATISGQGVMVSNFGSWSTYERMPTRAYNPRSEEWIDVPARNRVKFHVAKRLAALVAAGDPTATIRKLPPTTPSRDKP